MRWEAFKITTGFAGTPTILQVLADNGMLGYVYRMLQERDCPVWLYPVGMGATTIVSVETLSTSNSVYGFPQRRYLSNASPYSGNAVSRCYRMAPSTRAR